MGTKAINNDGGAQRVKVLLSDGTSAVSAVAAAGVDASGLTDYAIVDVLESIVNHPTGKKRPMIVLLGLRVVSQWGEQIGKPQTLAMKDLTNGGQVPQAAQPPHAAGGYGAPPVQNAYGAPPVQNAYGAPPVQNAYGAPPVQNAYGAPPVQNAYGAPPVQNAYGAPPVQNAYGAPPVQNAYGAPPQNNAYGAPLQNNAYGAPPPNNSNPYGNNSGPVARNDSHHANVLPINALNSYQNRWTIKARVTTKSSIRRYSNARGEGKFFSFDLLDGLDGEIRAVAWNDQCDRFYDQVEQGRVYYISKASLRNKRGNFNQTRHQFEIHLETNSVIEPTTDEFDHGVKIKSASFNFQTIASLEDAPRGAVVDVIGVVESIDELRPITRKDGSEASKRDLRIKDASNCSINLTLWDKYCSDPGERINAEIAAGRHPILACKGVRVGDFGGKNIGTTAATQLVMEPSDCQETATLRDWYNEKGQTLQAQALSNQGGGGKRSDWRVNMSQIRAEGIGMAEPAWVQALVNVSYVTPDRFSYPACKLEYNGRPCNKKVTQSDEPGAHGWFCERCNATNESPEHRYILNIRGMDHCGETWMTAFDEAAPSITGLAASELVQLKEEEERTENPVFSRKCKQFPWQTFVLTLKCTQERYQDEEKLRVNIMRVAPIDFKSETRWTLDALARIEAGQPAYPKPQSAGAVGGTGGMGGVKQAYGAAGGMGAMGGQQTIQAVYGKPANQNNNFGQAFL